MVDEDVLGILIGQEWKVVLHRIVTEKRPSLSTIASFDPLIHHLPTSYSSPEPSLS